ncbi:MAG: SDR family oxidoreductase [Bacteroidetes bacterium]|nr:SDR family oxidoreductase [Bacteroidota bacterium]
MKGKVALVTGGGRDIGRETSIKLAAAGASVCINYYDGHEQAKETLKMITDAGGTAILAQGDMTQSADVKKVVDLCTTAFGNGINVLVNIAGGLMGRKTIAEIDETFWDAVMNVNLKSVYLVCKEVIPHMPAGSAIVNFASQAARDGGGAGAIAYSTAKGGVLTFTRGLAKELGPKGIRVNVVCPGMINTTFHNTFTKPEVRANVAAATPLRREGEAGEVADLVLYLASGAASFITGASIDINGGTYFV